MKKMSIIIDPRMELLTALQLVAGDPAVELESYLGLEADSYSLRFSPLQTCGYAGCNVPDHESVSCTIGFDQDAENDRSEICLRVYLWHALYFHLYLGTLSDWQTHGTAELLSYLPTPRHAVEYIMETFPIVKRKDLRDYGTYRTKLRILEIYDQMTHCLATNTEYRSTLNPPPGPPCDQDGNFISVEKWDKNNWPKHIHRNDRSQL